jgi:hypothetical protein
MKWEGHVARMGEISSIYRVLVGIQDLDRSGESDRPPSVATQADQILSPLVSTLKTEEISTSETSDIYPHGHPQSQPTVTP